MILKHPDGRIIAIEESSVPFRINIWVKGADGEWMYDGKCAECDLEEFFELITEFCQLRIRSCENTGGKTMTQIEWLELVKEVKDGKK